MNTPGFQLETEVVLIFPKLALKNILCRPARLIYDVNASTMRM